MGFLVPVLQTFDPGYHPPEMFGACVMLSAYPGHTLFAHKKTHIRTGLDMSTHKIKTLGRNVRTAEEESEGLENKVKELREHNNAVESDNSISPVAM